MGKVLVQCGASEEARRGVPAACRSFPLPLEGTKPAAAAGGAECRAPDEGVEHAACVGGAGGGAAAQAVPEPDSAPAEVRVRQEYLRHKPYQGIPGYLIVVPCARQYHS